MADTNLQAIDGRVVVELDFGTLQSPDPLFGNGDFVYIKGMLEEPVGGWKTHTHLIQASSRELFLTRIRPKMFGNRMVRVRIGVAQGASTIWRAWETHYAFEVQYIAKDQNASQSGYSFKLITVDRLYTLDLNERLVCRSGTIEQIVSALATHYNFTGAAVEPTKEKYSFIQSFETDYELLLDRLIKSSINIKGLGNYQLYVQDDQLHFHTPGWKLSGIKTLAYGTPGVPASNLIFIDRIGQVQLEGAGGVQNVAYSPLAGTTLMNVTSDTQALRLADVSGGYKRVMHAMAHAGQNQLGYELAEAQNTYAVARLNSYRISFKFTNQPFLRPGEIINLKLPSANDSWSGLYYLFSSKISITTGRMTGVYTLARGELSDAQENFAGLNTVDPNAVVNSPYMARGTGYNATTASTSSLLMGTGDGLNEQGGATIEVEDPETS